jgi:ubiquinone/menaquinone biosynthesis C-methylase UbiE
MPNDEQLYQMYNTDRHVSQESHLKYYRDFRRRTFERIFALLKQLEPHKSMKILDVGVGRGWSFLVMRQFGHQPLGIDLNLADCVEANLDAPTVQDQSEILPYAAGSLDALLMTDILEHVRQPRDVLGEAQRVLTEGGYILLRIPDVSGVMIRALDLSYQLSGGRTQRPGRLLYSVHLFGFSLPTVSRYLEETGFKVVAHYGESSKNLAALGEKHWARNPLLRFGVIGLTLLGEVLNRQDELVVIARKSSGE